MAWLPVTLGLLGAILLAIFGYIIALTSQVGKLKGRCEVLECIPILRTQVDRLIYRQELEDKYAAAALHSPTHKERDHLVETMMTGELSHEELERLIAVLREARVKESTPDNRYNATLLLSRAETELYKKRRVHS